MDFFLYSRDAPGTGELRHNEVLLEEHWSYIDGFADAMIARGPTLAPDRETATGSLHVLALPSLAAANEFVEREPNNRAGMYADHRIRGFENLLGRTMWEFTGEPDEPRFLAIADPAHDRNAPAPWRPVPAAALGAELRERLIVYGALTEAGSGETVGVAFALQAPDRSSATALLRAGAPGLEVHRIELRDWEFGGRR
jgi:uncharacterized protein YciI